MSAPVTLRRLKYWFDRLNREVFSGLCPEVTLEIGPKSSKQWAETADRGGKLTIRWADGPADQETLKEVMAHEMVHCIVGVRAGHGGRFLAYRALLEAHNIPLRKVICSKDS